MNLIATVTLIAMQTKHHFFLNSFFQTFRQISGLFELFWSMEYGTIKHTCTSLNKQFVKTLWAVNIERNDSQFLVKTIYTKLSFTIMACRLPLRGFSFWFFIVLFFFVWWHVAKMIESCRFAMVLKEDCLHGVQIRRWNCRCHIYSAKHSAVDDLWFTWTLVQPNIENATIFFFLNWRGNPRCWGKKRGQVYMCLYIGEFFCCIDACA